MAASTVVMMFDEQQAVKTVSSRERGQDEASFPIIGGIK